MTVSLENFSYPVLCGLLGERPTRLSQAMHNAGFAHLGLPFTYVAFPTTEPETAIAAMRSMGIRGYSVTIPHKETVAKLLDELSEDATATKAVNTVINDGKKLKGYNTDCIGIEEAFKEQGVNPEGMSALILGAGGAARAAVYTLKKLRAETITVLNRTEARAEALSKEFSVQKIGPEELKGKTLDQYALIINTTSLGSPNSIGEYPISLEAVNKGHTIFDCVASKTRLIDAAAKCGAKVIRGESMLLQQALEQFRLFTGEKAPKDVMKAALGVMGSGPMTHDKTKV